MWNLITCFLSGRHDYQVQCAPGAIFLRCNHCGKRSMGWDTRPDALLEARVPVTSAPTHPAHATARG